MEPLSLLAGGPEHRVEDWESAAAGVLRKTGRLGADAPDAAVWEALTHRTLDGVPVTPLGVPPQHPDRPDPGLPGHAPFVRGNRVESSEGGWDIRPCYADADAAATNQAALADLQTGATSLWLTLGPGGIALEDLRTVLEGVMLDLAAVVLEAPADPLGAAEALAGMGRDAGSALAATTNLGVDPVGARLRGLATESGDSAAAAESVERAARLAEDLGVRALVVDATAVHDLGGSDAQELGYATAVGAEYLRMLTRSGVHPARACGLLEFRFAATAEQFPTIAKLRAARRLWHRVAELSGVPEASRGQRQHVVTSRPMMSKYDPWVNMLRTTVAAFSAGVGGADAVTVLPFDAALGLPDDFSRRIARNTSALLVSESHVARVVDPAGGSHLVETLTDDLARAGWRELGRIEESGGALEALADGSLAHRVEEVAARREDEVSRRTRPLTGVNEFPHLHERLPERRPYPEGGVRVRRYGAPFEALRDSPPDRPVFLATLGSVAVHTARATFASNLLAAGGVDVVAAGATDGVDQVLAAYDGQPVVCLAGHDRDYAAWGVDLVAALRAAGARYVILAGRPTDELVVDDACAVGVDALAFLTRVREQLEVPA